MSPRQIVAGIGFLLIVTTWSGGALIGQRWEPGGGAALAQRLADQPISFTGSLVDTPSLGSLQNRHAVYVPAYASIRLGSGKGKVDLASTLSIHNTSQQGALVVIRADYFDTSGNLIHRYIAEPIAVRPLGTVEAFVPVEDTRGGTGANFVVEWAAEGPLAEPIIEAVMMGSQGTQGYSFTSRGKHMRVIRSDP